MENVNHPAHYNQEGRKECIYEMVDMFGYQYTIEWCIITAYKYYYRAGEKENNSFQQDISKALWYLGWAREHLLEVKDEEALRRIIYHGGFVSDCITTMLTNKIKEV